MTALTLFFSRQIARTANSPRRLRVIMAALVVVAVGGLYLLFANSPQAIQYQGRYIMSTPAAVCPGETFTYPVSVAEKQGDAVSRITEGWCRVEDGICPKALQSEPYYLNFVDPYGVITTGTRTAPADIAPGSWQMRHCNETHSDGTIDVTCYQVAVEIRDCEVSK